MAKNLNIQNSNELKNQNVSLWRKGKQDIKKYYEVKLKNVLILVDFFSFTS